MACCNRCGIQSQPKPAPLDYERFAGKGLDRNCRVVAAVAVSQQVPRGQCDDQQFVPQWLDNKSFQISKVRSDKSGIDLLVSQTFDEFVARVLLQRQRHERVGLPKRADYTRRKWMKWDRRRDPDADSSLLASSRAPCRFTCVVQLCEHGAGIVEERAPSLGQFNTARLAAE